jgi:hypothetical protein
MILLQVVKLAVQTHSLVTVAQFKQTQAVRLDSDHGKLQMMLLTELLGVHLQILVHYYFPHYVMRT